MTTYSITTSESQRDSCFILLGNQARKVSSGLHTHLSLTGDLIGVVQSSSTIALTALNSPSSAAAQRLMNLEAACCMASGVNNMIDTGALLSQLLSGALFYQTGDNGEFLWKIHPATMRLEKTRQSPFKVASKLTRLFSKMVGSFSFLAHPSLKLLRLGSHALTVGTGVASSLSALSSACGIADDVCYLSFALTRNPSSAEDKARVRQVIRERVLSFVCNVINLSLEIVQFMFVFVPALLGAHALMILGIFLLLSSVFNLVLDIVTI